MDCLSELDRFYKEFSGEKGYIGLTEQGSLIPYFLVRKSNKPIILCQYSIHAREYITTFLALKQIEYFVKNGKKGSIYFIPAVNVDGIKIALSKNPLYKANSRGVDLNVNFDALWGHGEKNIFVKSSENYIGEFPFSESETKSLKDFTLKVRPDITLSYHSKGEEIYWDFYQDRLRKKRDYLIAESVGKITGYKVKSSLGSCGGYKDWCIDKLKITALTIEVGDDNLSHPIGKEHLDSIFDKNKNVLNFLTEKVKYR